MGSGCMIKYPILYEQNEQDFFHLGLGPIKTTTKATVTEERNGSFILDMTVVIDDEVFPLLLENRIIKADAGHLLKEQRFRIKRIVPNAKNKATIYAEHVSYLSAELPIKPDLGVSNGNAQAALNQWKSGLIGENEFTVDSDISTANSAKWRIDKFKNPREILGGVEGSILDKWGGEYRFDNYHISLLKKRGTTAETMLSYGRNITDFEQERNITTTYTSIYPYAIYSDEKQNEHLVTIDGYVVDVETVNNFPNRNVLVVDFSSEFDSKDIPTKQKLETLAKQYIKANNVGIPKVSIKVSFLDLSKTADYQNFAPLEQVNLCDDVFVRYPKQKVSTTAKVVKTVWNVLTETYDEIEIGEKRTSLSGIINQTEKKANEANTQSNQALTSANGKNTNFYGLYGDDGLGEPQANKVGDLWYKPNGEETEMYQWNGTIWEFIMSTAGITSAQEAADEAKKNAEDAKEEAEQATDSANKAVSDATHAVSVADQSKVAADEAKADAATAIENAQSILNDLQNLDTVNLLKNSTWNLGKGDWTGGRTYFEVLDPEQDKPSNFILHGLPLPVSTQQWTQIPHHIWCEKGQQFCVTFDYREINYTNNSILAYLRVFPEQNSVNTNSNALWHDSILHSEVGIESNSTEWKKVSYTFTVGASGWLNFIVYDGDASGNHELWYREIMVVRSSTVPKTWSPYPGDAQSQINLLNGQIVLKANQADVDVLNGTITNIESSLTTQAGQITFLNSLTDGHTTQLGSLQSSYEGLSSTIAIVQNDLDGKATIEQFSNLSQTVDTIQGTVANKAEQSQVTQLADQITSVVGLVESEGTNLILNGSFADASNWMIPTTTTTGFYSSAGCPIDAGTYIRVSSTSASHSIVQRPNASILTRLAGKTVNLSTYARALGTADNFRIYVRVTDSAGVNTYLNINTLYSIDTAWKRYSAVVTFPTDVVAVNITINFQNLSGIKCYCTGAQLTLGENLYPYTESTLNFATQSQITQLSDLINLRVVKGDVINQINISPESILIAGNKIQITGQTYIENSVIGTAQIKDAAITDAKIGNLSANKITTGSLNAANVNIINMNASNIVTGELTGITLRSSASGSSFYVRGNELFMQKANGDHLTMDTSGIYWYNSKGDILFQSSKKLTTSDIFGTAKYNAYLAAFNETRSVTYASALSGSGGVSDYSYVPHRTGGIYSNWLEVNTFGTAENLYIRPKTAESEVRITVSGGTDSYARLRARWIFADRIINNSFTNANHLYLHTNDEVRVRTMNLNTKTGGYRAIRASAFNTSSLAEYKTNIETFEKSALDIIGQSTIYSYNLKTDIETAEIGLVIGEGYSIAQEVVNGDGVSQYRMNSLSWKAIQELHEKIKDLENELAALKSA